MSLTKNLNCCRSILRLINPWIFLYLIPLPSSLSELSYILVFVLNKMNGSITERMRHVWSAMASVRNIGFTNEEKRGRKFVIIIYFCISDEYKKSSWRCQVVLVIITDCFTVIGIFFLFESRCVKGDSLLRCMNAVSTGLKVVFVYLVCCGVTKFVMSLSVSYFEFKMYSCIPLQWTVSRI